MSTWMKALRWAVAIPGGSFAALLVSFPLHWVVMCTLGGWGMDAVIEIRSPETLHTIERWLQALVGPLAFVYCASRIAPSQRRAASVAFTALVILAGTVLIAWVNTQGLTRRVQFDFAKFILQVVGAGGAICLVWRHERSHTTKKESTE